MAPTPKNPKAQKKAPDYWSRAAQDPDREGALEKAKTETMEPGVRVNPDPEKDTPEDRKPEKSQT
jgi:hypothetical protein